MPNRIQRKRTKGWRKPDNCRCVTRPGVFGNPFRTANKFRKWLELAVAGEPLPANHTAEAVHMMRIADRIEELRGLDLACYCPPGAPCHADVLIEYANSSS